MSAAGGWQPGLCLPQLLAGWCTGGAWVAVPAAGAALGRSSTQAGAAARLPPRPPLPPPLPADLKVLAIAEADHAAIPLAQREDLQQRRDGMEAEQQGGATAAAAAGPEMDEEAAAREDQWGAPKGEPGQWASCVR